MKWPVKASRKYRVTTSASVTNHTWSVAAGPWVAGLTQTQMTWTVGTTNTSIGRLYRVEGLVP